MRFFLAVCGLFIVPAALLAQKDRVSGQIDTSRTVAMKGNVHPGIRPELDEGALDPSQAMSLITLMLKPSVSQQAELEQLLADQQDPFSPSYQQWLTPEEYADRFGASPNDTAKITSWLQSEGFQVDDIGRGRSWIVFSGTAGQVRNAFHTELHRYRVDGEVHFANATDPSIPAALEPLVRGLMGLDDFYPKSSGRVTPKYTTSGGVHYLAPDDLATIYDLGPLYSQGFNGSGQKIVIAGRTKVDVLDIRQYRSQFNLPPNDPQFVLVAGSTDPGTTADLDEADLDIEASGAVARNATIVYVYSTNVDNSVLYAISQNLAPVISYSYGICEPKRSSGYSANLQSAAQQANAQGITWVASSGDSGAAECDPAFNASNAQATQGQYPSFPTTIPEVTGVGGTQFNEGSGNYWAASNSPNGGSALSYIPEMAWNESSTKGLASSGGGLSIFYSKPTWQTGPTGIPSQNQRAAPDVSLTAANHDGYLIVTTVGGTPLESPAELRPPLLRSPASWAC